MTDNSEFYVDGDDDRPRKIEVTVGVDVCFEWDDESQQYVIVGVPQTTDSGLYSDAVEGCWAPEIGTWIKNTSDDVLTAAIGANSIISRAVELAFLIGLGVRR